MYDKRIDCNVNEHGIITDPGKFEGEMCYVPYLWDMVGEGEDEYNCGECECLGDDGICLDPGCDCSPLIETYLDLDDADRALFPELEDATGAWLSESEQGFVYCSLRYKGER